MAKKTATTKRSTKKAAPKRPSKTNTASVKKTAARKPAAKKADTKKADAKADKKLSCIDAAAKVLAASKTSLTTKEMIEAMAAKKLWSSPSGKTPVRTLYSAILREISTKGKDSRFVKTERGKFAANK